MESNGQEFHLLAKEAQEKLVTEAAKEVLSRYPFTTSSLELINFEYNATFRVETVAGERFALRVNVNSGRSLENALAEVAFVQHLAATDVRVPNPVANSRGEFVNPFDYPPMQREIIAVLFTWLEGEEMGDEPTLNQVHKLGATLAQMHQATEGFILSDGKLPTLEDFFTEDENLLFSHSEYLNGAELERVQIAMEKIQQVIVNLYRRNVPQVIHADLHGWNVMFHDDQVAIFDFDDSGMGLPVQDLAIATYYLDTDEQRAVLLDGYRSVKQLPKYSPKEMHALLLHRRLFLLNYLFGSTNSEHREMIPQYLTKTMERVDKFNEDCALSNQEIEEPA